MSMASNILCCVCCLSPGCGHLPYRYREWLIGACACPMQGQEAMH